MRSSRETNLTASKPRFRHVMSCHATSPLLPNDVCLHGWVSLLHHPHDPLYCVSTIDKLLTSPSMRLCYRITTRFWSSWLPGPCHEIVTITFKIQSRDCLFTCPKKRQQEHVCGCLFHSRLAGSLLQLVISSVHRILSKPVISLNFHRAFENRYPSSSLFLCVLSTVQIAVADEV